MPVASSINVLVVDDQQTIRSLVRSGLQELGFRTMYEASDGEEGLRQLLTRVAGHARALRSLPSRELGGYIAERMRQRRERRDVAHAAALDPVLVRRAAVERATIAAIRRYRPAPFAGRLSLFLPSERWLPSATAVWASLARSIDVYIGPVGCDNDTMLREPFAAHFAALFRRCCAEPQGDAGADPSPHALGAPLLATGSTH